MFPFFLLLGLYFLFRLSSCFTSRIRFISICIFFCRIRLSIHCYNRSLPNRLSYKSLLLESLTSFSFLFLVIPFFLLLSGLNSRIRITRVRCFILLLLLVVYCTTFPVSVSPFSKFYIGPSGGAVLRSWFCTSFLLLLGCF